ncbi:hypothetical protein DSUL_100084 [Desulfovibrionales bacterium]
MQQYSIIIRTDIGDSNTLYIVSRLKKSVIEADLVKAPRHS